MSLAGKNYFVFTLSALHALHGGVEGLVRKEVSLLLGRATLLGGGFEGSELGCGNNIAVSTFREGGGIHSSLAIPAIKLELTNIGKGTGLS